jgi:uncharacterized repeat protein (TIGR02543 family)
MANNENPFWRRVFVLVSTPLLALALASGPAVAAHAEDASATDTTSDSTDPNDQTGQTDPPPNTTYAVTFDANGGTFSGDEKTVVRSMKTGGKYAKLPAPKKDRSELLGWFTSAKAGVEVKAGDVFAGEQDVTLYAHWEALTYARLVYDANGGTLKSSSKKVAYGKALGSLPKPTRSRYTFVGWYSKKEHGGSKITAKTKMTTKTDHYTVYARWAPKAVYQFDRRWAGKRYYSSIVGSGCGLTAMTMVVRSLGTKKGSTSVTPVTAAKYSTAHKYKTSAPGRTKDGFFTKWPKKYGVKATRTNTGDLRHKSKATRKAIHKKALNAVKRGDWVVAFMAPGNWTHVGHFILWYDIDGDRALVRDPNATKAAKTRAKYSLLQSQVKRYWIISVPDSKKLFT